MFCGTTELERHFHPQRWNIIWRLSVKIGDLVRDKDYYYFSDLGVIVGLDESEGMFKVMWNGRGKEWLTEMYLDVVS